MLFVRTSRKKLLQKSQEIEKLRFFSLKYQFRFTHTTYNQNWSKNTFKPL